MSNQIGKQRQKIINNNSFIKEKNKKTNTKGITLISLVVTIVIILILSGITISTTLGNNGIINKAKQAKELQEVTILKDRITLSAMNWQTQKILNDNVTIEDLFNDLIADGIVASRNDITGSDGTYQITTKDGYVFDLVIDENGNIVVEQVTTVPKVLSISVISKTTNSIQVKPVTTRLEDGTYTYSYKKSTDSNYIVALSGTTQETYTFTNLESNTSYDIKVTASNSKGSSECTITVKVENLSSGTISQKGNTVWTNGMASIELQTTETGVTIQYQINSNTGTWIDYTGPITDLRNGDLVYVRIHDGISGSTGDATISILDNLPPQDATISLNTTTTQLGGTITATVTHQDKESGMSISNCKWIYTTESNAIGTDAENYTGGTFTSNPQSINLSKNTAGTYYLHVLSVDSAGNKKETISEAITVKEPIVGGEFDSTKGVNTPRYDTTQMTPIKWNGSTWVETTGDDSDWYDYSTTAKKWANAKTSDGSMWVWIPRYGYQISTNYHTASTTGGTINIKFLQGTTNTPADGSSVTWKNTSGSGNWNVHPAFNYNGQISGIWVAKFEASDSSGAIKVVPGVQSWRTITVNDIYTKCLNYNTSLKSHMMKNSEWGAVAYLSQSSYGKNSEIWINNSSSYITGSCGNSVSASADTGTTNDYTSTQGVNASTTGNIYGIYDMSGGAWEYVAAYVNNGNSYLTSNGASLVNGASYTKDVYTAASSENYGYGNYTQNSSVYGDAVYETSGTAYNGSSGNTSSWYSDYSYFPNSASPFFVRGGYYYSGSDAGAFYFIYNNGDAYASFSFRPVLAPSV